MKETTESALLGLVRGQIGSLCGPLGLYGHALAVSTAIDVARAGGQTILITPSPPDVTGIDGVLVVDLCQDMPVDGTSWHRYLHHTLLHIRRCALKELMLVVIDQSITDDVVEMLKVLAEWHSVAIAYLPSPILKQQVEQVEQAGRRTNKRVSPEQTFESLAQISGPVDRLERACAGPARHLCPGNHQFYGAEYNAHREAMAAAAARHPNLYLFDRGAVAINWVAFIGAEPFLNFLARVGMLRVICDIDSTLRFVSGRQFQIFQANSTT